MAAIQVNGKALLDTVRQMSPEEFEAFLDEALSLRTPSKANRLSARETRLVKRINRGLPVSLRKRHAQLSARREGGILTAHEHEELLKLTHEAESRDADRAGALVELAKLRRLPVRALMKQMGIEAPPIRG
jgi:hypothetical protein